MLQRHNENKFGDYTCHKRDKERSSNYPNSCNISNDLGSGAPAPWNYLTGASPAVRSEEGGLTCEKRSFFSTSAYDILLRRTTSFVKTGEVTLVGGLRPIGCAALQSQPISMSNDLSQKSARRGQ
jgi:hypothetical protein